MANGIDATQDCSSHAGALKAAGYGFVGRYYFSIVSHAKVKLTHAEALALSAAGLFIVAVFENSSNSSGYFTHAKGVSDGTAAFRYAADHVKQPFGSPIYFAVDYDASTADLNGGIAAYFRGVAEAFEAERHGGATYPIGVYGSGLVCGGLSTHGLVTYTWLAQSTGWSGYHTFTGWNIKQGPETTVLHLDVDTDETHGKGGGFQVSA